MKYVDGGITYTDGRLSKRFVTLEHDVEFDGDRKRPTRAILTFTDEDGKTHRVTADSAHQDVNVYYGLPLSSCKYTDLGGGSYFVHFRWDSNNPEELAEIEDKSMSIDQLMRFEFEGRTGWGIFELLLGGRGYPRYPNWRPMDMSAFRQDVSPADRLKSERI